MKKKKTWEGGGFGKNLWESNNKSNLAELDTYFPPKPEGATYGGCGTQENPSLSNIWFHGFTPILKKGPRLEIS